MVQRFLENCWILRRRSWKENWLAMRNDSCCRIEQLSFAFAASFLAFVITLSCFPYSIPLKQLRSCNLASQNEILVTFETRMLLPRIMTQSFQSGTKSLRNFLYCKRKQRNMLLILNLLRKSLFQMSCWQRKRKLVRMFELLRLRRINSW